MRGLLFTWLVLWWGISSISFSWVSAAQVGQLSKVKVMKDLAAGLTARSTAMPEFTKLAAKATSPVNEYRALTLTGELCFVSGTLALTNQDYFSNCSCFLDSARAWLHKQ